MKLNIKSNPISNEKIISRLALESDLAGTISFFKTAVPSLLVNAKEAVAKVNALRPFTRVEKSKAQEARTHFLKLKSKFNGMEYSRYEKTLISCPEDFNGYYLDYTVMLIQVSKEFVPKAIEMLGKYQVFLASFVTNKEMRKKLQDHKTITQESQMACAGVLANLKVYFPSNIGKTKTFFGKVVRRMTELDELSLLIQDLEKREKEIEIEKILSMVSRCVELLDIIKDYASDEDFSDVSVQSIRTIAEGAKVMGEVVECMAVLKTKQAQIIFKVEDMFDYLVKSS